MIDVTKLGVARLDDYLGLWAMEREAFFTMRDLVLRTNLVEHVAAHRERERQPGVGAVEVTDEGVAVLHLEGFMTKTGSSFSDLQDGTVGLRRQIRAAVAGPEIRAIMLRVDSPGGSTKGVDDLAQEVARASSVKPMTAFIEDLGASGAYFVASQANRVAANASAVIGAIGTYMVLYDFSALFAKEGVKAIVVRAGAMKGAGTEGTEITEAQLAEFQRTTNEINEVLVGAMASSRGLSGERLAAVTDGAVHIGQHALEMGLVDAIETFDEAMTELVSRADKTGGRAMSPARSQREEITTMSAKQTTTADVETSQTTPTAVATPAVAATPNPATLAELKAKFPESDAVFREKCLEGNCTMAAAADAWIAELNSTIAKRDVELEQVKAQAKKPGNLPVGASPASASATEGDPLEAWDAVVKAKVDGGMAKHLAIRTCVHAHPEMHQAYLDAVNADRPTGRDRR